MNDDEEYYEDEYDAGDEAQFDEPGVPDELVAELAAEPVDAVGFNHELAAEVSPLLWASLLAIVLTEAVKPWGKAAMVLRKLTDATQKRAIQTMPFAFGAFTATTFGFREMVIDLTGVSLSVVESLIYGGASVGVVALVIYEFIHSIRPIKVARLRFYRLAGVTEEEVAAPTVRKMPPVDPDKM